MSEINVYVTEELVEYVWRLFQNVKHQNCLFLIMYSS